MLKKIDFKNAVMWRKAVSFFAALVLVAGVLVPRASAEDIPNLPKAGEMVLPSAKFDPVVLKGLTVDPKNPLAFDFIVDRADENLTDEALKEEAEKLIQYFLAALAIPEDKSWVNLSPYEKERIIPDPLAQTQMGEQMLEQDYLLKQLSASLTNPDTDLGKKYWEKVNKAESLEAGSLTLEKDSITSHQPLATNDFNKVWIVPQKAVVFEKDGRVFISESRLKVMMAQDMHQTLDDRDLTLGKDSTTSHQPLATNISSDIFRSTILPFIEKEVNEGKNFAPVRQIYNSVILATWYKIRLKETLLAQLYADKEKIKGIDIAPKDMKQKVYDQYLKAFQRGVYNIIKESYDEAAQDVLPRKYFSGGFSTASSTILEIRPGDPVVGSSRFRLVTVGGIYQREPANKEDFYTTLPPNKKEALKVETVFKPLESSSREMFYYDDAKVTVAYDQNADVTYFVFEGTGKNFVELRVPGNLSKTLTPSLFKSAKAVRRWLHEKVLLDGYDQMPFQQQALFNSVLAKAMQELSRDGVFNYNSQISNLLGLMESLIGQEAVDKLSLQMTKENTVQRKRTFDAALSEVLAQNPDFILNAAQLLGLESSNSQWTFSKVTRTATVTSTYNPQADVSIVIIRQGFERSVYLVRGDTPLMARLADTFESIERLEEFLSDVKGMKNTGSGYYLQSKGYILNGDYLLAVAEYKKMSQSSPDISEFFFSSDEELSDLTEAHSSNPSFFKRAVSRFGTLRQSTNQRIARLAGDIKKGVVGFFNRHSFLFTTNQPAKKAARVIDVIYGSGRTSLLIHPSDTPDRTSRVAVYVFDGDLRDLALGQDNLSAAEILKLVKIAKSKDVDGPKQSKLFEALVKAQRLSVDEFRGLAPTADKKPARYHFSAKIELIVLGLGNINLAKNKEFYQRMGEISVDAKDRKEFFLNIFLPALLDTSPNPARASSSGLELRTPQNLGLSSDKGQDVGGIDFNPGYLDLQIKRDSQGMPLIQENIKQMQIQGLYPLILNIRPVTQNNSNFLVSARQN